MGATYGSLGEPPIWGVGRNGGLSRWDPDAVALIEASEPYRDTRIVAKRHSNMGHTMGYALVPDDHPWYGLGYDGIDEMISVHGGVTFAGPLDGSEGHWLGFDSAHAGDGSWTTEQTLAEAKHLADQILDYTNQTIEDPEEGP